MSKEQNKLHYTLSLITVTFAILAALFLSPLNVEAQEEIPIPLLKAYVNGNESSHLTTDITDEKMAKFLTEKTGFKVNYAPNLANTPESARGQSYIFTNGINGTGPFGFQIPVFNAKPGDEGYSPLLQINMVEWNSNATARELKSVQEIDNTEQKGEISINKTGMIVNHPGIG